MSGIEYLFVMAFFLLIELLVIPGFVEQENVAKNQKMC